MLVSLQIFIIILTLNKIKMKTLQNYFLLFMLVLSRLALMLSCYQLVTVDYDKFNYISILVFNIPVLMSFGFCVIQLNDNFKK